MINASLSALWNSAAPAAANHLWQSSIVALAAGLMTLALRRQHARIRYWIWLAASMKFLVPFSVLVRLGQLLAWSRPASAAEPSFYFTIEEIAQPFAEPALPALHHAAPVVASASWFHAAPVLLALWLAGFLAVVLIWIVRWYRIAANVNSAKLLSDGREVSGLRRIERLLEVRRPISVLLSRSSLEPGIFGIARPVLLWPEGISHGLEDAHLEAILAHEVWHVRRRDNLFAVLHMLVEAVFWFYPLVWWMGARLVEERELACDEAVIALRGDRQIYAESILKVCEFCLGSPLVCVSGVTGADLKQRMVHIMSDRMLHKLNLAQKLLLTTTAFSAIAIPISFGVFHATPSQAQTQLASNTEGPSFASASVKPHPSTTGPNRSKIAFDMHDGTFTARGVTLQTLIELAYHAQNAQLVGGPEWVGTAKFDVDAKVDMSSMNKHAAEMDEMHKQGLDHASGSDPHTAMFRTLLADQFKLALHPETRNLPSYELIVDGNGPKLEESKQAMLRVDRGGLISEGIPMDILAQQLSLRLGRPVVDRTGLKGHYAFNLHWTPDPSEDERLRASEWTGSGFSGSVPSGPPLLEAVQQQLGLKLVPVTEPVQVLVIDHAEEPSQN
ncbi:MAG TPA: M56 family metallopeptidase [Dongiaceae bacterium]|nr:M56 family metallopeptidase [Dongiaceae bacterium]